MVKLLPPFVVLLAAGMLAAAPAAGVPDQAPKRGGTVVVGGNPPREPPCLNAYLVRCHARLPFVEVLSRLALRGPFSVGADNAFRPDLVTGVDYTLRPPYILTYHVRPEARWSDGVPITARDFAFTHDTLKKLRAADRESLGLEFVRSVRAIDAKTFRVVLRSRFAGWRSLYQFVLPSHVLRGEDFSTAWLNDLHSPKTGRPIGSGPFLMESWDRGRAVTYVRNPRYWKSHPAYLDRLVVRFCDPCAAISDEQVEWMRAGVIDVLHSSLLSGAQLQELRAVRGVKALAGRGANWEHLDLRVDEGGHALLKRKRVRQALAYAIDRAALTRALHVQIDARYPTSESAVFLTQSVRYRPNWRRYRHNLAEARRLLEQEGCRRGADGVYACDGRRLSLRLATVGANVRRAQTLELIRIQLRRGGIEIVPQFASPNVLFGEIVPSGNFDLVLFSWLSSPDSPSSVADLYGCGGGQNYAGYCQRLVTRDLDQARRILDPARQARVLNRADAQLAKDVPVIPLFENPTSVAHRTSVRNVRLTAQRDPFVGVEDWWLEG